MATGGHLALNKWPPWAPGLLRRPGPPHGRRASPESQRDLNPRYEQPPAVAALVKVFQQRAEVRLDLAVGPHRAAVDPHRHRLVEVDHVPRQPHRQLVQADHADADLVAL